MRNINDSIIKLTDKQILDYIKCPNLFFIKYASQIPIPHKKSFNDLVGEVINAYYGKLLENKLPTIKNAKYIWDRLCENNPDILTDKKILDGWGLVKLFDKYCYDNRLLIADTSTEYDLEISPTLKISGQLEALRINNNSVELFKVETSQKQPDQQLLDMSLKYTLQLYALNQMTIHNKITCVRILHLRSGKEFTTYRTKFNYDRLEQILINISESIRQEIYYPREDYTCPQCFAKNYCGHI